MHCMNRAISMAYVRRMITYKLWGKSAPIVPRSRPRRDMPFNGLNRTSSESIRQIRLFYRGR